MEFKKNIPIYLQIMDKLKQDISLKVIEPGGKLMSTRELAVKLKVNPNTVSRVYRELESENIVFTKRGMGTFVVEDENILQNIKNNMANDIVVKFIRDMSNLNISPEEAIKMLKEIEEE
ncbi:MULTISPECIES: GntR family transcriptional regulator [Psychrilyobacter]|uniref:GntR family transcriptional regulator n=1 Tax=Psychrilyobacter piezotolerans TaxID=2293438 RepID=A0ABX9KCY2_9FUSO|nr:MULTISPECIES: GntR family transcriptional regulator [Psychrilyobacter]MCS5422879.1 GntR family transcriptional regulator [Psychrilyobacter sp. S5]NDI79258.1 GntR family transcriptional regulator [Psychrilyobacter piezotolerans]RDE58820.1 GntR family transcriptional regulator [Psychrilyobacter sp. S5]REI39309.1 GntR family transcriptional regulator [Psychrilyobacter piezotolerans]